MALAATMKKTTTTIGTMGSVNHTLSNMRIFGEVGGSDL
jgi:hypothetical protein